MGLVEFLKRLFGAPPSPVDELEARVVDLGRYDLFELSRRLGATVSQLQAMPVSYQRFSIPKRSGGARKICAPDAALKEMQRVILYRLLSRLKVHPAATGFRRGESIVTNARRHVSKAVVLRMDVRDFFPSTTERRVNLYFRVIGWLKEPADVLTKLCTLDGGLPQGAPTSPALSNLVNYPVDARLAAVAATIGATYTRYADDITFSFDTDERWALNAAIGSTKVILADYGYRLHQDKKLRIARGHNRQVVTGLVVNESVNLPRAVRRRLRAIRHCVQTGRPATMTTEQLTGWQGLEEMIARQSRADESTPG